MLTGYISALINVYARKESKTPSDEKLLKSIINDLEDLKKYAEDITSTKPIEIKIPSYDVATNVLYAIRVAPEGPVLEQQSHNY
jgi:uncharacterized membrane protein YdfJ with MMPL/SSD domain